MERCAAGAAAVAILLWTSLAAGGRINSYAGPYEVVYKQSMQCPNGSLTGPMLMNMTGVVHHSRARGMVYVGEANLGTTVSKGEYGAKLTIAKWDSVSGWRDNFFNIDLGEFCRAVDTVGKNVLREVHRQVPTIPASCPYVKGRYPIPSYNISAALSRYDQFPVFPYGRYRGDLAFYHLKSKETHACLSGIGEVVPKIKKN